MVRASMVPVFAMCYSLVAQTPAPEGKHLSLQEAIQISLQNNLQVDIARQAREQTQSGYLTSQGVFDWNLSGQAQSSRIDTASNSPLFKGSSTAVASQYTSYGRSLTVDVGKAFVWGGSVKFEYAPVYSYYRGLTLGTPDVPSSNSYPYTGALSATYSQNLLAGFGREVTTAPMVVAQKNAQAADYTFQLAIINLVASTEGQYWDLVYAERYLANKKVSLELAQKQLKENTIRMQVGTMAPIDVTSAEAQVAQAEQDIIAAEASLANAKDALIRSLYPNAERPTSLDSTDSPTLAHTQLDEAAAVKMALERRVELKAARIGKEVAQLNARVAENKTLPTLSAFGTYTGNSNNYDSLSPVNKDLTGAKYPGYTVGLQFSMPIQNRAAKGNLSAARASLRSSELSLRDQELSITLQVRTAVRNVEAAEKGVKAAEKTRYYQQKNLEAEQKKFENGMSTNFVVLQVMTNLDNAKSAELQAQINYAKVVTALEQAVGNLMQARNLTIK
ncbi:TolC family protein [Geothrix sp. 21YS21S-2]|uniref:TolC family protein n=1 Tax=Geothrix sp. 21YS21S-2 TaxID=3068893 RepID=UPI0027B8BA30|nr:TolC family protein [Geothrix sp. 21YS21S-2]